MIFFERAVRVLLVGFFLVLFYPPSSARAATIIGSQERATSAQVSQAIMNSSLNSNLKQYANDIGQLAMFESGGRVGVYNGSCCTGLLQMNKTNLRAYGHTPESYANLGVNEQVEVWAKLTNSAAGAKSVQQLMSMESFDGKKVDGAMVLSCIQLGIGNCQTMLNSGSCRGFADSNGTSICDMADKIRGGKAAAGNPSSTGTTKAQDSPEKSFATLVLENADKCWVCTVIVKTAEVAVQVVPVVVDKLRTPVLPLMAVIFALVMAFMVGRGFIWPGLMRWSDIFWSTVRFTAVYALISMSAFASEYVMGYAFYPSLQIGSAIGEMGAAQGKVAFQTDGGAGNCRFVQVDTGISFQANSTIHGMSELACKMHMAAYGPVVAGATLMSAKVGNATPSEVATGVVVSIVAMLMIVASVLALAAFGMSVVEALLKLTVVLCFSPIILFFWVFRRTRYLSVNAFNLLMYSLFLLAFTGILASISSFVLSRLISQGMGNQGGNPTLKQVFDWVNTNLANLEMSTLVMFASFSIASAMMASHLLRAGADIASSLTGARMGQIAGGVVSGTRQAMMMSMALPAVGVGMLTAYAGTRAATGVIGAGAAGVVGGGKAVIGAAGRILKKDGAP